MVSDVTDNRPPATQRDEAEPVTAFSDTGLSDRALSVFDAARRGMTPERWFARYAHTLTDPASVLVTGGTDSWMQRLAELMEQSQRYPNLDAFRRTHLSWRECQQVRSEMLRLQEPGL
jgi:hypothetical protein